ncbi:DUF6199 family natural product biosynthesis protein [Thalassobacillus sp. CUG 92003]|uniref:DUF6199 family natural product biosynthesis protein n=1 Tax=Thalassobacillus sp. CUG 92003 TaxID=2736641 RepID=UPI00351A49E3
MINIFWSIFFLAMGVLGILSPHAFWVIGESWKSKDATGPTPFFIWSVRITSVFFSLFGLIALIQNFK